MEKKEPSVVYFCPRITPENLVKVYEALGRPVHGRVCAKLSTGEAGNDRDTKDKIRAAQKTEG